MRRCIPFLAWLAVGCCFLATAHAEWSFTGLGHLPGPWKESQAFGVSADGSVVVGYSQVEQIYNEAFRWTAATGMVGLGTLSGQTDSGAAGVSADGVVVVGTSGKAFRWTEAMGMVQLDDTLPVGAVSPRANAVSRDGSIVVGSCTSLSTPQQAVRWAPELELLPAFAPGSPGMFEGTANAVSADGAVIVGRALRAQGGSEACRWDNGLITGLGLLPATGVAYSEARAVSADGSVIVGLARSARASGYGNNEAFRWTAQTGMVGLGALPGGQYTSGAVGISADGRIIVGYSATTDGRTGVVWDPIFGLRSLSDVLQAAGVDLSGWSEFGSTAISADGRTIVGAGRHGTTRFEAFVAHIEWPAAWSGSGGPQNARWDVPGNWADNAVPSDSDVAFGVSYSNGNTIDLSGDRSAHIVTFTNTDANNLTFTNGTLALTRLNKSVGNGSVTFDNTTTVNIAGGTIIDNSTPGGSLKLAGAVNLLGPGVAIKGSQPLVLSGTLDDHSHGLTVQSTLAISGTTLVAALEGLGSTAVFAGGQLVADHVWQNQLSVGSGGRATIRPNATPNSPVGTSRLNSLSINGGSNLTGTLDLNNNSLIIDYSGPVGTVLSDVTAQLRSGRNGKDANDQATWSGSGIVSSKARGDNLAKGIDLYNLGAVNNADLALLGISPPQEFFAGQSVEWKAVLVKCTYTGDANLDGIVNSDDYSYWLNGFLATTDPAVQGWLRGDFDYNGVVDADDYTQWLNSFLFAGPPLTGDSPSPVPEPTTLALAGLVALCVVPFVRRRRT